MLRYLHDGILAPVAAIVAGSVPAAADVTISGAATQNMSCAANIWTLTAQNAVLNMKDLKTLLAVGGTEVTTT